jgi:hypothetical protein
MSNRKVYAARVGMIILAVTLAMSPSFGQGATGLGESRQERRSAAGQANLQGPDQVAAVPGVLGAVFGTPPASFDGLIVVGPNVRVNAAQQVRFGRSETTIASGQDGQRIVVGWNDARGFCGPPFNTPCPPPSSPGLSGFGFSIDGGATFTEGGAPPVLVVENVPVFTRGDPWLAADRYGNTFFYANLAVHAVTGEDLGVSIHRGRFSNGTFSWFDAHTVNSPNSGSDAYDKEAIAVDEQGRLGVVTVTNFQELCGLSQNGFGQIEVWRTADGGTTWLGPTLAGPEMPDSVAACGNAGTLQQSSAPAFGPNGEVYVTWQQGPTFNLNGVSTTDAKIVVARSLDGGFSFGPPATVATINTMRNNAPVGFNRDRINDHPRIAVATAGQYRGRIFVSFYSAVAPVTAAPLAPCSSPLPPEIPAGSLCRDQRLTSSQVFVSYSDDLGLSWSSPVAVASALPESSTGLKRWWPVVNVQRDGDVSVVYYESVEVPTAAGSCIVRVANLPPTGNPAGVYRKGPARSSVNTYVARSRDGGLTFDPPVKVSSATSDWCATVSNIRPNYGDYISATGAIGRVLATWADGRNGVADTFFAPIFFPGAGALQP